MITNMHCFSVSIIFDKIHREAIRPFDRRGRKVKQGWTLPELCTTFKTYMLESQHIYLGRISVRNGNLSDG